MSILELARWIRRYLRYTNAVSALEYAVIVGILVVGLGTAVTAFRGQIVNYITNQGANIQTLT